MIASGWRRLGISPFALVLVGLAFVALVLSRGAGSGWLVVLAAAFLGLAVAALIWSLVGLIGLRVVVAGPSDAVVGETFAVDVRVRALVPQLRTVTFLNVDGSRHVVQGGASRRVFLHAARRSYTETLRVEVRGGLPLGLFRFAPIRKVELRVPLAIAPVPAVVSLLDALGEDAAAEVRTVRAYVPGDPARLVHWRSTARRGELMVRELESAELLRGSTLGLRVSLPHDPEAAEAVASEAAGIAIAAQDAGVGVHLATFDGAATRVDRVSTRREIGRRLAAAQPGAAAALESLPERARRLELPR